MLSEQEAREFTAITARLATDSRLARRDRFRWVRLRARLLLTRHAVSSIGPAAGVVVGLTLILGAAAATVAAASPVPALCLATAGVVLCVLGCATRVVLEHRQTAGGRRPRESAGPHRGSGGRR